jgi:mitotic-spindle organizing protein 1
MPTKDPKEEKKEKAREVVDILEEVSLLLVSSPEFTSPVSKRPIPDYVKNTHLDRPQLSLCVSLIENGVNPEALAVGKGTNIKLDSD